MPFRLESAIFEDTLLINVILDEALPSGETDFQTFIRTLTYTNPGLSGLALEFVGTIENEAIITNEAPLVIQESYADGVDGTISDSAEVGDVLFAYEFKILQAGSIDIDIFDVQLNGGAFVDALDGAAVLSVPFDGSDPQMGPTNGPDSIDGTDGPDTLAGDHGNDTIEGGAGNDVIDGGLGVDTVVFDGPQNSHTVTISPSGTTVEDRRTDGAGADTLTGIELIDFNDAADSITFELNNFGGAAQLSAEELEAIIELYIAYFNRAPDAVGLNFWATAYANGLSLEGMAEEFAPQPETVAAYPEGTSNLDFATTVYNNVLGRTPDQEGLNFWVGALDNGYPRDSFILGVLEGAKALPQSDASSEFVTQQIADRAFLETKADIGAYFAVHLGMSNVDNARTVMDLFDGFAVTEIDARDQADAFYDGALDPVSGEFLLQIVGVVTDDFDPSTIL